MQLQTCCKKSLTGYSYLDILTNKFSNQTTWQFVPLTTINSNSQDGDVTIFPCDKVFHEITKHSINVFTQISPSNSLFDQMTSTFFSSYWTFSFRFMGHSVEIQNSPKILFSKTVRFSNASSFFCETTSFFSDKSWLIRLFLLHGLKNRSPFYLIRH